ncbi:cysteine desulfurase family protein [Saccharibacillus sp. CPCC 101409]|uniref:cysteine desulfurase family protein n=1 Tax=Saccharibacillus sp. CPCC 101409 TaxID=3058041 RepID=UPI002673F964|nr:cysteine desulfurase family protein [Saccharibacillus sp. CPCC 101409]MDO3409187.1 cysteine desulfurase family protein [Saccharibacillus sp. CPCC 101409]
MFNFDQAASTPVHPDVIRTIAEVMQARSGNPSSIHRGGRDAAVLLERSREVCAAALGAPPEDGRIVFTSGATESNNLAIKGALLGRTDGRRHIVTTMIEHSSVYESCRQLEDFGFEVTYVRPRTDGTVSPESVLGALRGDTALVSVMHVNNETGAVQPVGEIGRRLKEADARVLLHVDGVQGFGRLPLDLARSRIDLYSVSAHKVRGPKGVGLLFVRRGVRLIPLLSGGSQEHGLRAGTENTAAIVGAAKAFRLAAEGRPERGRRLGELRALVVSEVRRHEGLKLTEPAETAPHIVHFTFPGLKSEVVLHTLEELNMLVSAQSACAAKTEKPSRVLTAMGMDREHATSGIRISLGDLHTEEDVRLLSEALGRAVSRLAPFEGRKR